MRSGGSYFSQNDLRLHFGLDKAAKADTVEIAWPSGTKDVLKGLAANKLYVIHEGREDREDNADARPGRSWFKKGRRVKKHGIALLFLYIFFIVCAVRAEGRDCDDTVPGDNGPRPSCMVYRRCARCGSQCQEREWQRRGKTLHH